VCPANSSLPSHDLLPAAVRQIDLTDDENRDLQQLIKAEANLLRLPLFALQTKGLRSLDGIECRGRVTRNGETHQFLYRTTRNTATHYPGPLARSTHLAFLSLITDRGLPFANPLTWTWGDLCRRMGIACGGQMVQHLKQAITATASLLIFSDYAIYDKPDGVLLSNQQEALHLYDRVAFVGTILPDGRVCDGNFLWLAEWYCDNLNSLFTAPIDYALWRHLDARSSIASRLYEWLLLNFYSGIPVLRINYETLVQYLPIKAEKYRSSAERQLAAALQLLTANGILQRAEWAESKTSVGQLHLHRGARLPAAPIGDLALTPAAAEAIVQPIEVRELRNLKPPEWRLVADFYQAWAPGTKARPTPKELEQARDLIRTHGEVKAKRLIPIVIAKLKTEWPEAKTFGAAVRYLPDACADYERSERAAKRLQEERLREHREEEQDLQRRAVHQQLLQQWRPAWEALPREEREAIRQRVVARFPHIARLPVILERYCIQELARSRLAATESTT
jgi:hypothetical protein